MRENSVQNKKFRDVAPRQSKHHVTSSKQFSTSSTISANRGGARAVVRQIVVAGKNEAVSVQRRHTSTRATALKWAQKLVRDAKDRVPHEGACDELERNYALLAEQMHAIKYKPDAELDDIFEFDDAFRQFRKKAWVAIQGGDSAAYQQNLAELYDYLVDMASRRPSYPVRSNEADLTRHKIKSTESDLTSPENSETQKSSRDEGADLEDLVESQARLERLQKSNIPIKEQTFKNVGLRGWKSNKAASDRNNSPTVEFPAKKKNKSHSFGKKKAFKGDEAIQADLSAERRSLYEKFNGENAWMPSERNQVEISRDASKYAKYFAEEIERDDPDMVFMENISQLMVWVFRDLSQYQSGDVRKDFPEAVKSCERWKVMFASGDNNVRKEGLRAISTAFEQYAKQVAKDVKRKSKNKKSRLVPVDDAASSGVLNKHEKAKLLALRSRYCNIIYSDSPELNASNKKREDYGRDASRWLDLLRFELGRDDISVKLLGNMSHLLNFACTKLYDITNVRYKRSKLAVMQNYFSEQESKFKSDGYPGPGDDLKAEMEIFYKKCQEFVPKIVEYSNYNPDQAL